MSKYRTKPFEIEAVQFLDYNFQEIRDFVGVADAGGGEFPAFRLSEGFEGREIVAEVFDYIHSTWVGVRYNDYIIKGMKGEFYPCDPQVFETKYEETPVFEIYADEEVIKKVYGDG